MLDRYDACRCTKSKIFMGRKTGVGFSPGGEICLCTTMLSSFDAKIEYVEKYLHLTYFCIVCF